MESNNYIDEIKNNPEVRTRTIEDIEDTIDDVLCGCYDEGKVARLLNQYAALLRRS